MLVRHVSKHRRCLNFYEGLLREDELVKIAERVIPNEVWFGLATSLMSEHARKARFQASILCDDEE